MKDENEEPAIDLKSVSEMKKYLVIMSCLFFCFSKFSFGQNFILDERSVESYYNYWKLIDLIEASLKANKLDKRIAFLQNKQTNPKEFKILADKFNQSLPQTFTSTNANYLTIDTEKIVDSVNFIRWTYAKIDEENNLTIYLQLIVFLHIDYNGDNIFFPKVEEIKILSSKEITDIDDQKLKDIYYKKIEDLKTNPPPLPPPPPPSKIEESSKMQ